MGRKEMMDLKEYVVLSKGMNIGFSLKSFNSIGENMNILESTKNIIVCPTNAKGTMGKGLAKEFSETFPGLKTAYAYACRHNQQESGKLFFWQATDSTVICCLPTQPEWEERSHIGDAFAGIHTLACIQKEFNLDVAIPLVGTEFGDIDCDVVKKFILEQMNMTLTEVYNV
jgi:O-acetyl-ADP-ribose deacetylase (regulator of RNase III)